MLLKIAVKSELASASKTPRDLDLERCNERFLEDWRDLDLSFGLDAPVVRLFVAAEDFLEATERLVVLRPRPEDFSLLPLVDTRVRGLDNPFFLACFGTDLALDLDLTMALRIFDRAVLERYLFLAETCERERPFLAVFDRGLATDLPLEARGRDFEPTLRPLERPVIDDDLERELIAADLRLMGLPAERLLVAARNLPARHPRDLLRVIFDGGLVTDRDLVACALFTRPFDDL